MEGSLVNAQEDDEIKILLLQSYDTLYPWSNDVMEGIQEILDEELSDYQMKIEYMDTKYLSYNESFTNIYADYLAYKYPKDYFDLIISVDDNALNFLYNYQPSLFIQVPVFFCGVNNFTIIEALDRNYFTGVGEYFSYNETLTLMIDLHPKTKEIFIIGDNYTVSSQNHFEKIKTIAPNFPNIQFSYLTNEYSLTEMKLRLSTLDETQLAFFTTYLKDKTTYYPHPSLLIQLANASSRPIYDLNSCNLGTGIIGGKLIDGKVHGETIARLVIEYIVEGTPVANIQINFSSENLYFFDYKVCKKYGIDIKDLPEGSQIINLPDSIFKKYSSIVISALMIFLILIFGIVFSQLQIIQRKKIELQLRESEDDFRRLAQLTGDLIWRADKNGNLKFISNKLNEILGYMPEQLIGKPLIALLTLGQEEITIKKIDDFYNHPKSINSLITTNRNINTGKIVIFKSNGEPIFDKRKELIGYHGVSRDISILKETQEKLLHSQKMEAIGRLSGGIAHDFNNLLTVINGLSNVMLMDLPESDDNREYIEEILKSGERAAILTQKLLLFSRKQISQPKVTDLNLLIKNMKSLLERIIGENITLVTNLPDKEAYSKIDPNQFEQVIMNLAINARDAMPRGGKITIFTENITIDKNSHLNSHLKEDSYVKLSISDTGTGMNEDILSHLFEPFFTTKPQGKGTGLGLSIVYGIIQNFKGYIEFNSVVNQGSDFIIYLPLLAQDLQEKIVNAIIPNVDIIPKNPQKIANSNGDDLKGSSTILVVEDEEILRKFIISILSSAGYFSINASNPKNAIDICKNYPNDIDLVVSDVVMPDIDGVELEKILRSIRPNLKTLFISGYTENQEIFQGVTKNDINFLPKPFTANQILQKIKEILSEGT